MATLYRWASSGIRGAVLETIQIGGTRCTSEEALQRFFDRLGGLDAAAPAATTESASEKARQAAVNRDLNREGL